MSELSVDIKLNQQQAIAGAKALGSAFEDTATDMEKLVDAGEKVGKSTDDIARDLSKLDGRSFEEVRREVERADDSLDDLGDEADDARKSLGKLSDAGDDIGDKVTRGTDKAKEGLDDFKSEANQTARESAASFDGSAESIGDAFQEVAANAFGGFGPAGAVAGIAAAAGIGLAMAGFEDVNEAQERAKELAGEWAQTYVDEGSKVLSASTIVAKGLDILSNRYDEVTENAKLWGVEEQTVVAALAGSPSAIDAVTVAVDAKREASERDAQAAQEAAIANGGQLLSLTPLEAEYQKAQAALDLQTGAMERGATQADTYSFFLRDLAANTQGATTSVDEFGDSVITLPDGKQIYIDAETGQATDNVNSIESKVYGIRDKTVTVRVVKDTRDWDNWQPNPKTGVVMATRPRNALEWG